MYRAKQRENSPKKAYSTDTTSHGKQGLCTETFPPYTEVSKHGSFSGHLWRQQSRGGVGHGRLPRHHHYAGAVDHVAHLSVRGKQHTWRQAAFANIAVQTFRTRRKKRRVPPAVSLLANAPLVVRIVVFGTHAVTEAEDARFAVTPYGKDRILNA